MFSATDHRPRLHVRHSAAFSGRPYLILHAAGCTQVVALSTFIRGYDGEKYLDPVTPAKLAPYRDTGAAIQYHSSGPEWST
ncbi:MAG: hypothetical protein ACE14T_10000 [Syntrophales bacterium]